jgi:FMN phosphatase YigB (HAD superfamily)
MMEVFGKNPVSSREFPVVLWDAAGVLCHFQPSLDKYLTEIIKTVTQAPVDITQLETAWVEALRKQNAAAEKEVKWAWSVEVFLTHLLESIHVDFPSRVKIVEIFQTQFSSSLKAVFSQSLIDSLDEFKQRGYRLGIVSNWDDRLPDLLKAAGILGYFESVQCASRHPKPSTQIFFEALDDMDVTPDQAIHIGESYALDVIPAQRAGLASILYDPSLRELRALAETHIETSSKIVSIDALRQSRRLAGIKVATRFQELTEFLL